MQPIKRYPIQIDTNEVLRYLGYHGHSPDIVVSQQLARAIQLLKRISAPTCTFKVFELIHDSPDDPEFPGNPPVLPDQLPDTQSVSSEILLRGTSIRLTGADAATFLKDCSSCIITAVTIGHRVDEELRRQQITDMSSAVILDSCASSAVESICNQLETDLEKEYESRGLFLTDRFSPGYGDLPLSLQPAICSTLSTEKTIGLSVTGGIMMTPTKSVTALIGIADRPQPKRLTGCSRCRMNAACNYRKAGVTCAE